MESERLASAEILMIRAEHAMKLAKDFLEREHFPAALSQLAKMFSYLRQADALLEERE